YVDAFPSGHATTAFVVAAAVLLAWPDAPRRALTWGLLLLAAGLVAFSRIAVGAHWPADVAVGACGGWLCGALGAALTARLRFWQKDAAIRLMAGIALIASLALLLVNVGYPEARLYQIGLGAWGIGGAAAALMRERSAA
ncbi:MAG TPA: phosphatase PAP2 family protein, partial [Rhodocyclaceae bacterium]|nr:phosphatase PAP2 family protein [Rhodocyclaceae bacterium]